MHLQLELQVSGVEVDGGVDIKDDVTDTHGRHR
jgi:hypothetical protein